MRDSFKFDGGMRDEKQNITRYGRYLNKCNYSKAVLGLTFVWRGMAGLRKNNGGFSSFQLASSCKSVWLGLDNFLFKLGFKVIFMEVLRKLLLMTKVFRLISYVSFFFQHVALHW